MTTTKHCLPSASSNTPGQTIYGQFLGTGTAQRKKDAEQLAAREAMERIHLTLR